MKKKKIILSILICTIEGREDKYLRLQTELIRQIKKYNLLGEIQILKSKDKKGEHSIGYKRNLLLQNSEGEWIMFVDDDDMLCEDALPLIMGMLKQNNPDVISLNGILTTDGGNPEAFIHSLIYTDWFEENGIYCRPPNHLNPMRSSIAKQFQFPDISHGEDKDWSMQICKSGLLKTEFSIGKPFYFYNYLSNK